MIRFRGVGFAYRGRPPVVAGLDLEIGAGLTLLLGPNGCGKSTLLKLAAGVEVPDKGQIDIEGEDVWKSEVAARQHLVYVPEHPDLTPYATVEEIVALVCHLRNEPLSTVVRVLEAVGLKAQAQQSVRELSMGQRRRAVLACAFVGTPRCALLDEPLEAMDRAGREHILAWIDSLLTRGCTVVVVSHDIDPFLARLDRAISLRDRRAVLLDPVPDDPALRRSALEGLARS